MSSGFYSQNGRWPDPKSSKQKGGAGYFPNYSIFCILLVCCFIRKKHVHRSHHTVWSHNFQKMDVCSHRNIVSSHHLHLITPKKICSHHQFLRSHRHNFVHTIKMLITLLKILFTLSKFWSHHLFSGSHRHNFFHTIKILFTLWKFWVTPSKFCSHHLNYIYTQE